MFRAFKSQNIAMQLMIPVLGIIPFVTFIIFNPENPLPAHNAQGWLYAIHIQGISRHPGIMILLAYLQIIIISLFLFVLNARYELLGKRTVLLSYLFLILATTPLTQQFLHPAGLSTVLIFAGLLFLFRLYHNNKPLPDIFNAGFLLGMAILCYPPFILVFLVYVYALIRLKPFEWRDFAVLMLGLAVPVWIMGAYLILSGNLGYAWQGFRQWLEIRESWPPYLPGEHRLFIIWFIWLLVSVPAALTRIRRRKDAGRRIINVLLQFMWIVPVMIILFEKVSLENWQLMALPLSVLYSIMILDSRKESLSNLILLIHLIFLAVFQIWHFVH